jgi:molybdate transport system substrate-binding protein
MLKITTLLPLAVVLLAPCAAQQITVAAAADLNYALKDLAAGFEQKSGTKVGLSFGASGNLYSQIQNGAPFDLFFSADAEYPAKLADAGLLERASLRSYAVGHLVIWAPGIGEAPAAGTNEDLRQILLRADVKRIAIANPEHAPYGRAAMAALVHLGIKTTVAGKLVLGENVSQAAQFVQSGNAQAGFVSLSLVTAQGADARGYWSVPQEDYPEIRQVAGIVTASKSKTAAQAFLDFVLSAQGATVLQRYGFSVPAKR